MLWGTQLPQDLPILARCPEKLLGSPDHPSSSWVPAQGHGCRFEEGSSPDPTLLPLAEKCVPLRILYEQYGENLTQDNLIKVVALLTDSQTGDTVVAVRDVYIQNPEIRIRVRVQCSVPGGFGRGLFLFTGGCCGHQEGLVPVT